jgi:hypothetical protein
MKQKREITFEVEETTIVRQGEKRLTQFCRQCQAPAEMLTPEIAARLSGLSEREIFRLIENGQIHFVEVERVFVCRDSLTAVRDKAAHGFSNSLPWPIKD